MATRATTPTSKREGTQLQVNDALQIIQDRIELMHRADISHRAAFESSFDYPSVHLRVSES